MAVLYPYTWTIDPTIASLLAAQKGAFADKMFGYLRAQGHTGSADYMLYEFLGDLGYTGTIEKRMDAWEDDDFAGVAGGDALLLETGDFLLLETGDKLLLE
jgi:hypothetical protein